MQSHAKFIPPKTRYTEGKAQFGRKHCLSLCKLTSAEAKICLSVCKLPSHNA